MWKVLSQGIHMCNMKALSLLVWKFSKVGQTSRSRSQGQKLWYPVKGIVTRNTHVQYESPISSGLKVMAKVSLSLRKKSRHQHVSLQVWQLITRSQFDDWRHIVHHWKGNFHSFDTIFPQDQKSRYAPAKYELFYCSLIKPTQRYLADFGPRYHNKKGNL